jgi:hypothetical protein
MCRSHLCMQCACVCDICVFVLAASACVYECMCLRVHVSVSACVCDICVCVLAASADVAEELLHFVNG